MEKRQGKESIVPVVLSTLGVLALAHLSTYGFSQKTKDEAFENQGCVCPVCHSAKHKKWEGHHAVPRCIGGGDGVQNCVTVGGDKNHDCHEVLDQEALQGTIFLPPDGPFVPVTDVPISLFKNPNLADRAAERYERDLPLIGALKKAVRRHREKHHRRHGYRGQGR